MAVAYVTELSPQGLVGRKTPSVRPDVSKQGHPHEQYSECTYTHTHFFLYYLGENPTLYVYVTLLAENWDPNPFFYIVDPHPNGNRDVEKSHRSSA